MTSLTEPAKLLLLVTLLAKDNIISNNGKAFMKELILRRDPRLGPLIEKFEKKDSVDMGFLEEVHTVIGAEVQSLYDELFSDTSLEVGKTLSKQEREEKELSQEKSLIYGEVEFESFYRILRKINPAPGGVFYDLGSGTGKAVFAARLTRDFDKCIGIEILTSLHQAALAVVRKYNEEIKSYLSLTEKQQVAVFEGSFCDFDWSDGDLVFANSTCFSDELMQQVSDLAGRLKPGSIVVTFTKGMTSPYFELLERNRYGMSWGPATVFIHRRLDALGRSVGPAKLNVLPSDQQTYESPQSSPSRYHYSNNGNSNVHYDMDDIDDNDDENELIEDNDEDENDEENDDNDSDEEDEEEEDEEEEDEEEEDEEEEDEDEEDEDEVSIATRSKSKSPSVSPSKIYPESTENTNKTINNIDKAATPVRSPPSLKTQDMTEDDLTSAQETFNMLNSPLDSMLLLRKRNSQHAHPLLQTHALSPTPLHPNFNNNNNNNGSASKVKPPAALLGQSPLLNKEVMSPPKPPTPSSHE